MSRCATWTACSSSRDNAPGTSRPDRRGTIIRIDPPWSATLTSSEHALVFFALTASALALIATLVRFRFTSTESQGVYRTASLTATAVIAIAAASYVGLLLAFFLGYRETAGGSWVPNGAAEFAWAIRYVDWCVTVPLLVVELVAVSAIDALPTSRVRTGGVALAIAMVICGYLGAFVVADGRSFTALALFGVAGALCFVGLYAIVLLVLVRSVPRMPSAARTPYRGAVMLLLVVWLAYPIVYGLQGATTGGVWATVGQLVLCTADVIAKIGFGTLIHRTAVVRSRADELADPGAARPRTPEADAVWVAQDTTLGFDDLRE